MNGARAGSRRIAGGALAPLLIAFALLLRLAIPDGWMPDASAQGWTLMPCDGVAPPPAAAQHAMAGMAMGAAHADHAHHKHTPTAHQPCPFAAAAQPLADLDAPPVLRAPPPIPRDSFVAPRPAAAPGRGLAAPPPLPTGPPLLA